MHPAVDVHDLPRRAGGPVGPRLTGRLVGPIVDRAAKAAALERFAAAAGCCCPRPWPLATAWKTWTCWPGPI